MTIQTTFDDICARKHGGNENSVAANERAAGAKARIKSLILNDLEMLGSLTLAEFCERHGYEKNAVSGRFSELKRDVLIYQDGRRDGCGVWRLNYKQEYLNPFIGTPSK